MGFEVKVNFKDDTWYHQNMDKIKEMVTNLPSFVMRVKNDEFLLKDSSSKNTWEYDVRIFITEKHLLIEVSSFSDAFTRDIRYLYEKILQHTNVSLVDDDGEIYHWHTSLK